MLTKITVRNFKRFGEAEVELGNPVVFIGPNNSGKTSALQALALWDIGLKRWNERRSGKKTPEKRPGVTVNRRDLVSLPMPNANLLWHELRVRDVRQVDGRQRTSNVRIDIVVEGVTGHQSWICGLEFDYANEESFYCRPLRLSDAGAPERMPVPEEAGSTQIAFLPAMSGLAATETRLDQGAVNVRIGGRSNCGGSAQSLLSSPREPIREMGDPFRPDREPVRIPARPSPIRRRTRGDRDDLP